jgi:hypothetical protein
MPGRALGGIAWNAREAKQGQDVDVVPLEGHREGDYVKVRDRRLRLERHEAGVCRQQFRKFLFWRQEKAFTDDVVLGVEEAVHRLEAEVGHANPIGVRKGEGDAQPISVRLDDVADLFGKGLLCAFA